MSRRFESVVVVVAVLTLGLLSAPALAEPPAAPSDGAILALAQPALGQAGSQTTFPASEAGISAYVKVDQVVDLAKARTCFRGIQAEGDTSLIGIVELDGLPEEVWPHLYVNTDGWFLAYYSKYDPASKLMPWNGYEGGPVNSTTLRDALFLFTTELFRESRITFSFTDVDAALGYYDFRYPEATRFVLAVDNVTDTGEDSFRYAVPLAAKVYEASWAHCAIDIRGSCAVALSKVDGTELSRCESGTKYTFGVLQAPFLTPETSHNVELASKANCCCNDFRGKSGMALTFIYR